MGRERHGWRMLSVENVVGRECKSMPCESTNSSACDGATIVLHDLYIYYILPT
jgi:hypothetical protein